MGFTFGQIKHWSITVTMLFCATICYSQNGNRAIRSGIYLMEDGFYVRALEKFNSILQTDSSNTELNLLASTCYLNLQMPEKSLQILNITEENDCQILLKAKTFYLLENFESAKKILLENNEKVCDELVDREELLLKIENAERSYKNSKGFVATNFGPIINSEEREYSSVMINNYDSVLFTSRRKDSKAEIAKDGMAYESIFITGVNKQDEWTYPLQFKSSITSNKSHDATVQIYETGKKVIIFHDGDLYTAEKRGNKWINQERLDVINTPASETHCFITPDQNAIYFASDFETENGDLDIFITKKNSDGSWTKPTPVEELNTPYDEDAPFLADDGTFYFSSRGHGSIGGFDVFATTLNDSTNTWNEIRNLGNPINTVADDIYFNTYGKLAYISSSRLNGYGLLDLYRIFLFNKIRMRGKLIDRSTNKPIPGANIDFEYGPWFLRGYSDFEGNYEMQVPINKTMQVTIQKDSVNIHKGRYKVHVFLSNNNNDSFDFVLDINPNQGEDPELQADLFSFSDTVKINLKVKNDLERNEIINSVSPSMEKPWVDSLNELYSNQRKNEIAKEIEREVEKEKNEVKNTIVNFDLDKYTLSDSAKQILNDFYHLLANIDYQHLEINGHTDNIGSDKYNQNLSLKRAQSVYQYLSNLGVDVEQMISKGFGEQQLIIRESNNELNSPINRRVEIIIKK